MQMATKFAAVLVAVSAAAAMPRSRRRGRDRHRNFWCRIGKGPLRGPRALEGHGREPLRTALRQFPERRRYAVGLQKGRDPACEMRRRRKTVPLLI